MMLEKYLQEIGLSDKEAAVYLALLSVDNASVLELARMTKLIRTTIYVVIESLKRKGLVSEVQIGKKTRYYAEPPERLETFVERQKVLFEERTRRVKDLIPQIKSVQRESGERPLVKYFDGRDAAFSGNTGFFETAGSGENIGYFITNYDLIHEIFTENELAQAQKLRPKRKIQAKTIYSTKSDATFPSNALSERKRLDQNKYPIFSDISIYRDRVQFVTLGKNVSSILIQSRDVADTLKTLFKLAFEKLP